MYLEDPIHRRRNSRRASNDREEPLLKGPDRAQATKAEEDGYGDVAEYRSEPQE